MQLTKKVRKLIKRPKPTLAPPVTLHIEQDLHWLREMSIKYSNISHDVKSIKGEYLRNVGKKFNFNIGDASQQHEQYYENRFDKLKSRIVELKRELNSGQGIHYSWYYHEPYIKAETTNIETEFYKKALNLSLCYESRWGYVKPPENLLYLTMSGYELQKGMRETAALRSIVDSMFGARVHHRGIDVMSFDSWSALIAFDVDGEQTQTVEPIIYLNDDVDYAKIYGRNGMNTPELIDQLAKTLDRIAIRIQ